MPRLRKKGKSRGQTSLFDPIYVDGFAGGGGWSVGFELATGKPIDIAINHSEDAVKMHMANHKFTEHICTDIFDVHPRDVVKGRRVAWAHFSPDCTHFSKAKGGQPKSKEIRSLAWIVLRWAGEVRPDIISVENVEEFKTWGPLRNGRPIENQVGQTFEQWKRQLVALGYEVEHRELVACDYGAPTSRKRLFIIARCDGKPIVWPEATHGDPNSEAVKNGELQPWRTAAEIIDWTKPCPSIFATKEEIKEQYNLRAVRPLAENTMKRVIRGVNKFVLNADEPYIVSMEGERITAPAVTVVNHTGGGEFRGHAVDTPLPTITGKHGYGVAAPVLSPVVMANNENAAGRTPGEPIGTICTGGTQMEITSVLEPFGNNGTNASTLAGDEQIMAPVGIQYHTEQTEMVRGQSLEDPLMTVDTANRHAIGVPCLAKYYGNDDHGQSISVPLSTTTSRDRQGVISTTMLEFDSEDAALEHISPDEVDVPFICKHFSGAYNGAGSDIESPLPTVTAIDHNSLGLAHVVKMKGDNLGQAAGEPVQTVTAFGTHFGMVTTTIVKVRAGAQLQNWPEIRRLLNVHCDYWIADDEVLLVNIYGTWYFIADIGLRMLTPRELYLANGFPVDYIIDVDAEGKPYPKTEQVARCGNAVPPPFATALVRANAPQYCKQRISTMAELNELIAV